MSEYKPGVLIHNYNEDQFGEDLVKAGKATFPTPVSITHTAYRNPKAVAEAIAACGGPDEAGPAKVLLIYDGGSMTRRLSVCDATRISTYG